MKKFIILLVVCLMSLSLLGCTKNQPNDDDSKPSTKVQTVKEGVLTVSMSTDYAPFEFVDLTKTGQDMFCGSDVQVAKTIAAALGLELEIKSMDFDAAMVALDNGIVDLCIEGISWSPSREAKYDFSKAYTSEENAYQAIVVLKENADKYPSLQSLNNEDVKLACQTATIQAELAKEQLPNATLNIVAKYDAAWEALKKGSVDAVLCDSKVFEAISDKEAGKFATTAETFTWTMKGKYALAKKGNTQLIDAVNKAIEEHIDQATFEQWSQEANDLFAQLGSNASETIVSENE